MKHVCMILYDRTNIYIIIYKYQLYSTIDSIINLLSLHIHTLISLNVRKAICTHDPSETLQSSSSLIVVHNVIGSGQWLFQGIDKRHAASFRNHECWLFEENMSYLVVSWTFCCWILCDGWAEMATGQCKYAFLSKLTPATCRTLIYQKLSTSCCRRSNMPINLARRCFSALQSIHLNLYTLSCLEYFGHVLSTLLCHSKGWHLILGLCGHLQCEIQPNQKQLAGESAWVATMVLLDTA